MRKMGRICLKQLDSYKLTDLVELQDEVFVAIMSVNILLMWTIVKGANGTGQLFWIGREKQRRYPWRYSGYLKS